MSSGVASNLASRNEHNKSSLEPKEPEANLESKPDEEHSQQAFPEGGARAWSVAAGCAGILSCTFGYVNAFG